MSTDIVYLVINTTNLFGVVLVGIFSNKELALDAKRYVILYENAKENCVSILEYKLNSIVVNNQESIIS